MIQDLFRTSAEYTAHWIGTWWAFTLATASIVVWLVTGPLFGWSDTWQLVINTATTVITYLLVFIIQYTQNRDSQALHVKLDELLRAVPEARNAIIDAEHLSDEKLELLSRELRREQARADDV